VQPVQANKVSRFRLQRLQYLACSLGVALISQAAVAQSAANKPEAAAKPNTAVPAVVPKPAAQVWGTRDVAPGSAQTGAVITGTQAGVVGLSPSGAISIQPNIIVVPGARTVPGTGNPSGPVLSKPGVIDMREPRP
jgi:hypothetical protein